MVQVLVLRLRVLAGSNYQVSWLYHGSLEISKNFRYQNLIVDDRELINFEITEKFCLILIEGSYQYLRQLESMTKSGELLVESGLLIMFGEYLSDNFQRKYSSLPNLSSMRQLSKSLNCDVMFLPEVRFSMVGVVSSSRRLRHC